jgi:hypothetical protein
LTGIYKVNDHLTTSLTVENLMDRAPPPANYAGLNYNPTFRPRARDYPRGRSFLPASYT